MWTALAICAALYLAIIAALYFGQRSLIFPAPRGLGAIPAGFEPVAYSTSDGLSLNAGFRPARAGKPTLVYFHGNGADWQSSAVATDGLVPIGFGVLAAEYRSYRDNPGRPSEEGLYRDGRGAVDWLKSHGVDERDMVIVGNSIGGGVATQLATEYRFRALILISPFASLPRVAAAKLPWLPVNWLLRDRFVNIDKIADVHAPVLILHGDRDDLIPANHSIDLARANPNAVLQIVPRAGHDLAWWPEADAAIADFLDQTTTQTPVTRQ